MAFDAWGYSWGGPFTRFVRWSAVEQVTLPSFGPPFLDGQAAIVTSLGGDSFIAQFIGANAKILDALEGNAPMSSSRISRSAL